ncbi:hypothetical protein Tco_0889290 [Tanacetum coccineum]
MRSRFKRLRHDQKYKKRKLSQGMQLIQKHQDDQKRVKKSFEDVSGTEEIKPEYTSRSRSLKTISRNTRLHSDHFTLFLRSDTPLVFIVIIGNLPESTSNSSAVDAPVMRTGSAAAKPYQGDSFELTGNRGFPDVSDVQALPQKNIFDQIARK